MSDNIYIRGGLYWFRYKIHGKTYRGSTGVQVSMIGPPEHQTEDPDVREKAVKLARQKKQQKSQGGVGLILNSAITARTPEIVTLKAAVDDFLKGYCRNLKQSTTDRYQSSAVALLDVLGAGTSLKDISRAMIAGYVKTRYAGYSVQEPDGSMRHSDPVKSATIRRDLACLSRILALAVNDGVLEVNVLRSFDKRVTPEATARVRWLQPDEWQRLLDSAGWMKQLIEFAVETGMRWGEQFGLKIEHVNLDRREAYLFDTKTGQPRVVPLSVRAMEIVRELLQARDACLRPCQHLFFYVDQAGHAHRWTTFHKSWKAVLQRAKIADFRWHDLRHHAASRWVQQEKDIYHVSQMLGHKNISQTQKYAHLATRNLHELVSTGVSAP